MRTVLYVCILVATACLSIEATQTKQDVKRILLNDDYYTIISKLDALTKEVETLKTKLVNRPSSPIAFVAKLTTAVSGSGHHIYFDDVALNMGNAYNPHHGTFVAPVNGTYEFSLKACSAANHFIVLDIMVNTVVAERMIAGDTGYFACSSTTLPIHLTAGDDVYVKQGPSGDNLQLVTIYAVPHFNGVLLQAD